MPNKPRKPRKWLRPNAIEREYRRYVIEAAAEYRAAVEAHVRPILGQLRMDAVDDIPEAVGWLEVLRRGIFAAAAQIRRVPLVRRVEEFATRISGFNAQQFHGVIRSAYGVDIFQSEPWLVDVMRQWEAENIRLIKSIPEAALESLHGKIVASVRAGRPVSELADVIESSYGVTRSRAELIANDQVGKLNGQLTRERQKRLGVEEYIWRGSLDQRERDAHVIREGKRFSWDAPPYDGHPGEPIRCRCTAEPVLPLLDDIQGLQYPDLTPARGASLTNIGTFTP